MRSLAVLALLVVVGCRGCDDDNPIEPPPPDGPTTEDVICEELPPASAGTCDVTPASGSTSTLVKGVVLTQSTVYRGGQVVYDSTGKITCVGCDCAQGGELTITCPDGAISPGLINTHDHITFTQNPPYTDTGERYEHRHQWRRGQDMHTKINSSGGATADQVLWGELRFLMGGATSIVGSGGQKGLLRNLDRDDQEGLAQNPVNFDTFPLDDSGGTRQTSGCNYGDATTAESIANDDAYEPHTSEGIDKSAHNEFLCQSSDENGGNDLLLPKTAMIHAIGLKPADYAAMAQASTGLIWSPRSNITLYGDTARVTTAHRLGVEIALGTDWMPTGSMNLLRELRCAAELNESYYNNYFNDLQLWQMVTLNAALLTATDDVIGVLEAGKVADLAIFNAHGKTFRAVVDAEPQDVVLVVRGGKLLYGDASILTAAAAPQCDTLDVCGTSKQICLSSEINKNLAALTSSVGNDMYPAFTCGTPSNEPTCIPSRGVAVDGSSVFTGDLSPTDGDGDGISDMEDLCPTVFDPIRPMDEGVQGDADGDGDGDACDVCPLDADSTTCTTLDPNDRDSDGIANNQDNCPDDANADQADADSDGKGDVCDPCPDDSNPGAVGCPATVYSIKMGTTPVGSVVRVSDVLITGKGSNGFFVQVKDGDPGFAGVDFSGMFVFTGSNAPTLQGVELGKRATIDGRVANFFGQLELEAVTQVTLGTTTEAPPDPVVVAHADVKTGGTRAAALEGVIVELGRSRVTANNPQFGEYTLEPFNGDPADSVIGDDFLFSPPPAPLPNVNSQFMVVKGILAFRNSNSKINPRGAADLTNGLPQIASFGPSPSFARTGTTVNAPTFPVPLTITLTGPVDVQTTITLTSDDPTRLTVANVVLEPGASSAVIPVTAEAVAGNVTVSADVNGDNADATVRVLGAAEQPTAITISPTSTTVTSGGSVELTVTLDIPPPDDAVVTVAVSPPTSGTVPASVTVLADQTSATFTYVNNGASSTVTATFGGDSANATITVNGGGGGDHLVINEVDYDQLNTDAAEFIEIHNPSNAPISLAGVRLLLVNGADLTVYADIDLTNAVAGGSLAANGYLVIAGPNISAPLKFDPGFTTNEVQNGPTSGTAGDGVVLVDMTSATIIDALSYEGFVLEAALPGFATPQSLVEGTATAVVDTNSDTPAISLCRKPDGQDTDNAVDDWATCTPSPGMPNP